MSGKSVRYPRHQLMTIESLRAKPLGRTLRLPRKKAAMARRSHGLVLCDTVVSCSNKSVRHSYQILNLCAHRLTGGMNAL